MPRQTITKLNSEIMSTVSAKAGFVSTSVYFSKGYANLGVTISKSMMESDVYLMEDFRINEFDKHLATPEIIEFYKFAMNLIDLLHNE